MKRTLSILLLGFGIQGETSATQPLSAPQQNVMEIIGKMEKNDELSAKERQIFDQELQKVQNKMDKQGIKAAALTHFEQGVYSQGLINKIKPTINEILENGLNFPWGMDLNLLEERGTNLRHGNVPKGGADLSSVVTSYQKQKENAEVKIQKYTQEKNEALQEIEKITKETKEKLDALNSVNFLKRPSAKQKIEEEERSALDLLRKTIEQRNKAIKGVEEANETAIKSIMSMTKLDRQTVENLPNMTTWKDMKAHPEKIPQKIEPAVFGRHRLVRKSPSTKDAPLASDQQEKENIDARLPPVPKRAPPRPKYPPSEEVIRK
jgi:hypothetical protein